MAFICDDCRKRSSDKPHRTATGRSLCASCNARLLGAAAGVMGASSGAVAPASNDLGDQVRAAVSTSGWLQRVRRARGKE